MLKIKREKINTVLENVNKTEKKNRSSDSVLLAFIQLLNFEYKVDLVVICVRIFYSLSVQYIRLFSYFVSTGSE